MIISIQNKQRVVTMSKIKCNYLKYEEAVNSLEGISILIESLGYRIVHDGAGDVDYSAFCTIQETLLEKKAILDKCIDELVEFYKEVKRLKEMKQ